MPERKAVHMHHSEMHVLKDVCLWSSFVKLFLTQATGDNYKENSEENISSDGLFEY